MPTRLTCVTTLPSSMTVWTAGCFLSYRHSSTAEVGPIQTNCKPLELNSNLISQIDFLGEINKIELLGKYF